MAQFILTLVSLTVVVSALPVENPVVRELDPVQYQNVGDADGNLYLADMWMKASDLEEASRYEPDTHNMYRLFTRTNPSVSQPIVFKNETSLRLSNFSAQRRTIVLIHGWRNSATFDFFTVLVPALDPALPGWITNSDQLRDDDGEYTEVIHTDSGLLGFLTSIGQVDFYPNGGVNMPGCSSVQCNHSRAYYYFAESILSGEFTGTRCALYLTALIGMCPGPDKLHMGGITPKTGDIGIFFVETNAAPPFSRD